SPVKLSPPTIHFYPPLICRDTCSLWETPVVHGGGKRDVVLGVRPRAVDGNGAKIHCRARRDSRYWNVFDAVRSDLLEEDVVGAADDVDVDRLPQIVGDVKRDVGCRLGSSSHFDLSLAT